jgi:carboxyl-terminal processing protease
MTLQVFKKRWLVFLILLVLLVPACSIFSLTTSSPSDLTLEPTGTPVLVATATETVPATQVSEPPTAAAAPAASPVPTFTAPAGPPPAPSPLQDKLLDEIWQTINDKYLYRDFNGLDWNAVHTEYAQRVAAGLTDDQFYQAIYEMIQRLGDNHSTFFSPTQAKQMDEQFAGQYDYAGIGVVQSPDPERKLLTVVLVFPGSPAEQVGIQPHDNILAVDGQSVYDEQGNRLNLLRGPVGTTIQVTIQTPGQPSRVISVTRQQVNAEMPVPHQVYTTSTGKRVGYLLLPTFNEGGISALAGQAITEMSANGPLDGLIVDNRHNTGGTSQEMLNTLSYFVSGPAGYFVNKETKDTVSAAGVDIAGSQKIPLVVLMGKNTVSFGEVFSGILKDLERAYLIGEPTEGNVELLSIFNFSDGSRAWIATGTFRPFNHPDQVWEKVGVQPDLIAASQWDQVTQDSDPVIQAALQHFDQTLPGP